MRATLGVVTSISYGSSPLSGTASPRCSRTAACNPPPLLMVFPTSYFAGASPRIPANPRQTGGDSARESQRCGKDVASRPTARPAARQTGYVGRNQRRTERGAQTTAADPAPQGTGLHA